MVDKDIKKTKKPETDDKTEPKTDDKTDSSQQLEQIPGGKKDNKEKKEKTEKQEQTYDQSQSMW